MRTRRRRRGALTRRLCGRLAGGAHATPRAGAAGLGGESAQQLREHPRPALVHLYDADEIGEETLLRLRQEIDAEAQRAVGGSSDFALEHSR
jgi:hypothetical protein